MDETIVGKGDHDDRDWLIVYLFVSVFMYLFIFGMENELLIGGDRLIVVLLGLIRVWLSKSLSY